MITVTNRDIREIQMAKAALYSGARLLMDKFDVESVDRVVLAGAFGAHISPKHAMILGMIPDAPLDKVTSAGNAAGTGARIALLNREARSEIEATVKAIHKIETAIEPRFQEHFVNASAIPNSVEPFPILNSIVTLPTATFNTGGNDSSQGGRAQTPETRMTPNQAQKDFWSEQAGTNWVRMQDSMDATLGPVLDLVLEFANLQSDDRVLDIGCGAGTSTLRAGQAGWGSGSCFGCRYFKTPFGPRPRARE